MSEKGEKAFSQPKAGKSALKSPASVKGKDDNSVKSKKGRKVQFDSEDSSDRNFAKSNGKSDATAKGGSGKGGKGDKNAKAGKSATPKAQPPLELKVEQELSENTKCLMDCEASEILQGVQDHMAVLSADPSIKIPISFDRGLMYAKRGSHYSSPQTVRELLEPLKKLGVTDGEICVIANICPETVEEVFALVPSLKSKKARLEDALKTALDELTKQKIST